MSAPVSTKILSESEAAVVRAEAFRLFALFFRHPRDGKAADEIRSSRIFWQQVQGETEEERFLTLAEKAVAWIAEFLKTSPEKQTQFYEALFGHTANSKVPSYELEYGEEHSHRQPQQLADIAAFYQAFGLEISPSSHERLDHISVELEFAYFLLYKRAYALSSDDPRHVEICRDSYRKYLVSHLGRWAPAFLMRLSRHASEDSFYHRLSAGAYAFILQECEAEGIRAGSPGLTVRPVDEKEETGCVSCQAGAEQVKNSDDEP